MFVQAPGNATALQIIPLPQLSSTPIDLIRETVGPGYPFSVSYEDFRQGELLHTWSDISKAQSTIGFSPQTALKDGLAHTWAWFLENWPSDK